MEFVTPKIHHLSESSLFWNCSKLNPNFQNAKRKSEKVFSFWDNCIWRFCSKLPIPRRKYLSLVVSVLPNIVVLRFCIRLTETFSHWISFTVVNKYGKAAAVKISTVFRPVFNVTSRRVLWSGTFYTFI